MRNGPEILAAPAHSRIAACAPLTAYPAPPSAEI